MPIFKEQVSLLILYRLLGILIVFLLLFTSSAIGTGVGSSMIYTINQIKQVQELQQVQQYYYRSEVKEIPFTRE